MELEFGVADGTSFALSLAAAAKFFKTTGGGSQRFFVFDSFAGLPHPHPSRDGNVFQEGEYSFSRQQFERRIRKAAGKSRFYIVSGFYEDSLKSICSRAPCPTGIYGIIKQTCA